MDHGFFLFKFSCEEDCTRVLEENGQNFGGRPLILQRWEPNTTMEKEKLTEIPIWIKLRGLHLKFWNHHCLSRIASLIGKPLYMDTQTAESSRLNYARLCVLVSVDQSLPDSIKLRTSSGEIIQQIDYDWKPSSCSFCKDFSHSTKACHLYSNHVHPQPKKEWRPVSKIQSEIVSDISGSALHQHEDTNQNLDKNSPLPTNFSPLVPMHRSAIQVGNTFSALEGLSSDTPAEISNPVAPSPDSHSTDGSWQTFKKKKEKKGKSPVSFLRPSPTFVLPSISRPSIKLG
ncbi:uncharacterized protein At4g02000-like [Tasmannia lanceolata]|uniref:uncharacterized protein At4g02000-like n=1 Tax=Tasmannia lanceolata TaxID=3420 RepID=UPI004064078F